MPRSIRMLKDKYPDLVSEHDFYSLRMLYFLVHVDSKSNILSDSVFLQVVYTDVALDPYSSDGHDGIVREDGMLSNLSFVFKS